MPPLLPRMGSELPRRLNLSRVLPFILACLWFGPGVRAQTAPDSAAAQTLAEGRRLMAARQYDSTVALLEPLVRRDSTYAAALLVLGNAHRRLGHLEVAATLYQRAAGPGTTIPAWRALFGLFAEAGRNDEAFRWLELLRTSAVVDLSGVAAMPEVSRLKGDPRFDLLQPDRIRFEPAFVEPEAHIIQQWRGESPGDEFGWIARGIGDVDNDLVTDVVISATQNPPFGSARGLVYAYSGKTGRLLWKQEGDSGAVLGTGLESAGDTDGDGAEDVVAGAPGINSVLVFSGRDGRQLLRLRGDSVDGDLGAAVSGVGDVDGDGRSDIVAGAPSSAAHGPGAGRVYVFSGRDGRRLATLDGERPGDGFGSTVGGGGAQVIVGGAGAGPRSSGRVYLYHGLELKPRFVADADATGSALGGMFVSVLGDVNRDGVPDIYVTDFSNTARGPSTGRAYVYSGTDGASLLTLTGDLAGEGFGIGAGRTGDLNGDGSADLVVGSWQYGAVAWSGGRVQVLSGKDGKVLQRITGKVPGETLGFDAVAIGDVDGDGKTDFLVTSAYSLVNGNRSGRVFIVAGSTGPAP